MSHELGGWPFLAAVVVERSVAPDILRLLERGRRSLRVDGVMMLRADVEAVIEALRVVVGHSKLPAEVPMRWITTVEAGQRIGVTRQHVGRMAATGLLLSQRVGRSLMVAEVDVAAEVALRTSGNLSEPDLGVDRQDETRTHRRPLERPGT